ncbi:uncharacterized protein [Tenebrio molitor]|uniref:uncharacterized protein isoform X1 n=3 Tax=Tenebrio molitor TaxID=7067 RepID=UPI0036248C4E
MGNKLRRDPSRSKTKLFYVPESSLASKSITIPSICDAPSFHLSVKKSTSNASSEVFNWHQMQSLYLQQEFLSQDHLTTPILKVSGQVLEALKRQMGDICGDLQHGTAKMPDAIFDKFGTVVGVKNTNQASTTSTTTITKKTIVHFVTLLYVHDMILNYFRLKKSDLALDLIKQVAVSHALMGVAATEFRMMDWFIIHYLIKNKVTSDESINNLTIYLNTISNYIAKFYETQSVRSNMMTELTTEKQDDRYNKARENFRLMKKWKKQIESFKDQEQFVELLLDEQSKLHYHEEDERTIDTEILKEKDCIMKHFAKKKRIYDPTEREEEPRLIDIDEKAMTTNEIRPSSTSQRFESQSRVQRQSRERQSNTQAHRQSVVEQRQSTARQSMAEQHQSSAEQRQSKSKSLSQGQTQIP